MGPPVGVKDIAITTAEDSYLVVLRFITDMATNAARQHPPGIMIGCLLRVLARAAHPAGASLIALAILTFRDQHL
jgi:hypothetical protein